MENSGEGFTGHTEQLTLTAFEDIRARFNWILTDCLPAEIFTTQGRRLTTALALAHLHDLSQREQEVFVLMGLGVSNRQAAAILEVSERTIKSHISNILTKLYLESRLQIGLIAQNLLFRYRPDQHGFGLSGAI